MIALLPLAELPIPGPHLSPGWALLLALALVFLNGFFVAAEFALVKVRPTQIAPLADEGGRRALLAQQMGRHLDAYLSGTQLGITLTSLALGWIGEPAFAEIIRPPITFFAGGNEAVVHSVALAASFLTITMLHIVLGELLPKSVAIRKPEETTLWIAYPLYVFYKVTYPAIWLLNKTANGLLRLIAIPPAHESEVSHDEEELRLLLASTHASHLSTQKREILDNVFELSHRMARQIMVPRGDVVYLSTQRPLAENLRLAKRSAHTRFPLCHGDLDHVIGMVHVKDLFLRERQIVSLEKVAREIVFVPETLELDRLLKRMRHERFHFAAVIDEYGGVSGIVTLENVLEEIVGQIQDEFDFEPDELQGGDGVWIAAGSLRIHELEDFLDVEMSDRDEDTLGGVVLSELGRGARVGDRVELGPVTIEVLEVELNRIKKLRLTLPTPEPVAEPTSAEAD